MKLVLVCGEPGSGKSTLMTAILASLPGPKVGFKYKLLHGAKTGRYLVLGIYKAEEKYPGTDRLSMAVQPSIIEFLTMIKDSDHVVVAEGDRISNGSLLHKIRELRLECQVFKLDITEDVQLKRLEARGSTFDPKWLAGRYTKNARFAALAGSYGCLTRLPNNTPQDLERAVTRVMEALK